MMSTILRRFTRPERFIFDALNTSGLGEMERTALLDLMKRFGELRCDIAKASTPEEMRHIERDRLRPALVDLRRFRLRKNTVLVRPFWGSEVVYTEANTVAFFGGADVGRIVASHCDVRGLRCRDRETAWGAGGSLWHAIRECAVAVFDLRANAPSLPETSYACGLALALGRFVVLLGDAGARLPFNFDAQQYDACDPKAVREAIDAAHFTIDTVEQGAVEATRSELMALMQSRASLVDSALSSAYFARRAGKIGTDPLLLRAVAETIIAEAATRSEALAETIWPAAYPSSDVPMTFHVMPFSTDWANEASEAMQAACADRAIAYERGDKNGASKIISGIWNSISRSTFVTVDVTGLNVNVCMELGFAHVLGRPVFLVRRQGTQDAANLMFPALSKLQVVEYKEENLGDKLEIFLYDNASTLKL